MGQIVVVHANNETRLLTINGAPVVLTEYENEVVNPNQIYPNLTFDKKLQEPVMEIHTRALMPLIARLRETADKIEFPKINSTALAKQKIEGRVIELDFKLLMKGIRNLS